MSTLSDIVGELDTLVGLLKIFVAQEAEPPPPSNPVPPPVTSHWEMFIKAVALSDMHNTLKLVLVAQAIQETGRGKSDLFKTAWNPAGMKWREEMKGFAVPFNYRTGSEPSGSAVFCAFAGPGEAIAGYLRFLGRSPYAGWSSKLASPTRLINFIASCGWAADPDYAESVVGHLQEAEQLLFSVGGIDIPSSDRKFDGLHFLIDPGHSASATGARGKGPTPPLEYAMNLIQAKHIANFINENGGEAEIYDPNPDSLKSVGRKAEGKHAFISLHHNAANADGRDEGTEVFVASDHSDKSMALARKLSSSIALALGARNRGAKTMDYTVIFEAQKVCPIAVLVESYFIDDYDSIAVTTKRSMAAAVAICETLEEFFA